MRIPPTTPLTSNNVDKLLDSSGQVSSQKDQDTLLHNRVRKQQDDISNMTNVEQLAYLYGEYSTGGTIEKCVSNQKMQKANDPTPGILYASLKPTTDSLLCLILREVYSIPRLLFPGDNTASLLPKMITDKTGKNMNTIMLLKSIRI